MSHSRKDMNETLTEVLLAACVTPALMPDRLLMEHVLLVSIIHHSVGLEVNTPIALLDLSPIKIVILKHPSNSTLAFVGSFLPVKFHNATNNS